MQIFIVKSIASSTPLAEVRTDGKVMEFVVDNTQGNLPSQVGRDFTKLKDMVQKSSYLSLEQPEEATANMLRYLMSNGDVVEVSTDGKTVELNGEMLDESEKTALFDAVRSGQLKVGRKADPSKPTPVMPTPMQAVQPDIKPIQMSQTLVNAIYEKTGKDEDKKKKGDVFHDSLIEAQQAPGDADPSGMRNLAYYLKYGAFKGDPNGRQ